MKWWAIIGFIFVVLWVCKVCWVLLSIADKVRDDFTYPGTPGIRLQANTGETEPA